MHQVSRPGLSSQASPYSIHPHLRRPWDPLWGPTYKRREVRVGSGILLTSRACEKLLPDSILPQTVPDACLQRDETKTALAVEEPGETGEGKGGGKGGGEDAREGRVKRGEGRGDRFRCS